MLLGCEVCVCAVSGVCVCVYARGCLLRVWCAVLLLPLPLFAALVPLSLLWLLWLWLLAVVLSYVGVWCRVALCVCGHCIACVCRCACVFGVVGSVCGGGTQCRRPQLLGLASWLCIGNAWRGVSHTEACNASMDTKPETPYQTNATLAKQTRIGNLNHKTTQ